MGYPISTWQETRKRINESARFGRTKAPSHHSSDNILRSQLPKTNYDPADPAANGRAEHFGEIKSTQPVKMGEQLSWNDVMATIWIVDSR